MNRISRAIMIALLIISAPISFVSAATPVSNCGEILLVPGEYKLTTDLSMCSGSFAFFGAITIASPDVHLHLKNHAITCLNEPGVPNTGITILPGLTGIHIKQGMVSGCDVGILMFDATYSKIGEMSLRGNLPDPDFDGGCGLIIEGGHGNEISNSDFSGNRLGICMGSTDGNRVANNAVIENFASGIDLNGIFGAANNNTFSHNVLSGNGNAGIAFVGFASGNTVHENTVADNLLAGIGLISIAGFPGLPIPESNEINGNTALNSGVADLIEAVADFSAGLPPSFIVVDPCRNQWRGNTFDQVIGPNSCFGESK